MIRTLETHNVGPFLDLDMRFARRLNVITGDNGLGKTFLLDVIWWSLTNTWPRDVNTALTLGYPARPRKTGTGTIAFSLAKPDTGAGTDPWPSTFDWPAQAWRATKARGKRPRPEGIVLYAMADGSFAVWDSARNSGHVQSATSRPAYVFTPGQVWNGLGVGAKLLCPGLVVDWARWQGHKDESYFTLLKTLLQRVLPPGQDGQDGQGGFAAGPVTRISVRDSRDMPTLRVLYSEEAVPLVFASQAVRRLLALAYMLVWVWVEHRRVSDCLNLPPARNLTLLIDAVEAQQHPSWQRSLVPALLQAVPETLGCSCQFVLTTHSPLVLVSLESCFEEDDQDEECEADCDRMATDALFHLAREGSRVVLEHQTFLRWGSSADWLTSDAFGLPTDYPLEKERIIPRINTLVINPATTREEAMALDREMRKILCDTDTLWLSWRAYLRGKSWL